MKLIVLCIICPCILFGETLDFNTAAGRALTYSPELSVANSKMASKQGEVRQSRLYPNPIFNYEVENVAGNKDWRGWDRREERAFVGQLIETGNKRGIRMQAASYEYFASVVGYEASKLALLNKLSHAFIDTAAAQELLELANEQYKSTEMMLKMTTGKVDAGKLPATAKNKADVALISARMDLHKAQTNLSSAKRRLALLWGASCPDFDAVSYPFYEIICPCSLQECLTKLCSQPEVVQAFYNTEAARQNWRREKANRVPDVVVTVGYKGDLNSREQGLMAGVSFPLPVFDQNQGNICRSYADMLATDDQGRQLRLYLESKLAISYDETMRAYDEAEQIRERVLPSAKQSYEAAYTGFQEGKLEYLDVLDAQHTLFDAQEQYVQSLVDFHYGQADIHYLNSQTD